MEIEIRLTVDVDELEVDCYLEENSITTEYGGNTQTDRWLEVDISSIEWKGIEIELDCRDYDELVNYIIENPEKYA